MSKFLQGSSIFSCEYTTVKYTQSSATKKSPSYIFTFEEEPLARQQTEGQII